MQGELAGPIGSNFCRERLWGGRGAPPLPNPQHTAPSLCLRREVPECLLKQGYMVGVGGGWKGREFQEDWAEGRDRGSEGERLSEWRETHFW